MAPRFLLGPVTVAVAVAASACASSRARSGADDIDDPIDAPAADGAAADAAGTTGDGGGADGPPPMVASLLLSEIVLAPTGGELIEIVNPTATAVDLSRYYLSDTPSYFRLPAAGQSLDTTDFIVRFPAGATIAAGGVVTVAIDTAANFTTAYPGVTPSYSIAGATMVAVAGEGTATLTNAGEPIILFFWDGASDKVTDVDIMLAGTPTAGNALTSKSGVVVDGPDADTTGATYAADAMTAPAQTAPGSALSTKRLALESAALELQTGGGNGVAGHDETSEQLGTTWDTTAYTAATPGQVPAALVP